MGFFFLGLVGVRGDRGGDAGGGGGGSAGAGAGTTVSSSFGFNSPALLSISVTSNSRHLVITLNIPKSAMTSQKMRVLRPSCSMVCRI